ncbi:MAG: hypothetical protein JOZ35_08865 [Hyphomicrobiales bacterium]|nr:hypothetical protein [Hyphomicrobiales bacterium]
MICLLPLGDLDALPAEESSIDRQYAGPEERERDAAHAEQQPPRFV